jgi:hypothetical protein
VTKALSPVCHTTVVVRRAALTIKNVQPTFCDCLPLLQAHRHRQGLRGALQAWQEHVQHKRRRRQLLLRAEACYVFMTLLRVLQQWHARTTDKQMARLRAARWGTLLTRLLRYSRVLLLKG